MHYICFDASQNIEFESAGRFVAGSVAPHPQRVLKSAVLLIGYSGECAIAQDGREHLLTKGTFQILFPEIFHKGTKPVSENQSHFWCHFYLPDGFFVEEAESSDELSKGKLCVLPEFAGIGDVEKYFILFSQMIDESEKSPDEYTHRACVCDSYIKIILMSLADSLKNQNALLSKNVANISKIKEYLRVNACNGLRACGVAEKLGYNSDYLSRLIKADTGLTMSAYLNSLRIKNAKNLLINSSATVSEIAYASGFCDEKYFLRQFRKHENMTPTQYRNAYSRIHINN